jgi:hypothetical protein
MFIHQQDTGRQLVFLLLLGYMCEKLATECDRFMTELDRIMNLNVSFWHARPFFPQRRDPLTIDSREFSSTAWSGKSPIEPFED